MAILREKRLKEWKRKWKRKWKIELIEKSNPKWIDLFEATFFKMPGPSRFSTGQAFFVGVTLW